MQPGPVMTSLERSRMPPGPSRTSVRGQTQPRARAESKRLAVAGNRPWHPLYRQTSASVSGLAPATAERARSAPPPRIQSGATGLRQIRVAEPHRHRSFADGRSRAPDGPTADVTYGKDSRQAGLEQERVAIRLLPGRSNLDGQPGRDEALFVESQRVCQPRRRRIRPDKDEESRDVDRAPLAGVLVLDRHPDQLILADQFSDTCLDQQFDVGGRLNAVNEVARHVVAQIEIGRA